MLISIPPFFAAQGRRWRKKNMNESSITQICISVSYIFTLMAIVFSMCYLLSTKRIGNPATLKFAVSLLVVISGIFLVSNKIDAPPLWALLGSLLTFVFSRQYPEDIHQDKAPKTHQTKPSNFDH